MRHVGPLSDPRAFGKQNEARVREALDAPVREIAERVRAANARPSAAAKVKPARKSPARAKIAGPEISEHDRQVAGQEVLTLHGYTVLVIGHFRQSCQCPKCKEWFYPNISFGNTSGTPDTFITHFKRWPWNTWMAEEWKTPTTPIETAQQDLVDAGASVIVMDDLEAVRAVLRFEWGHDEIEVNPALVAFLSRNGGDETHADG